MKELFKSMFCKWLLLWVLVVLFNAIAGALLDYIFNVKTPVTFLDAGFHAFVILWCFQQDKLKREGK